MMLFVENIAVHHGGILPVETIHIDAPPTTTSIQPNTSVQDILSIISNVANNHITYSQAMNSSGAPHTNKLDPVDPGGDYSTYSDDYGYWNPEGGIDYAGSNQVSDGPKPAATDAVAQIHLTGANEREDGSYVNVYFSGTTSDGKNGDNAVTYGLAQVTHDILAASPSDINYVNVSATTNGVHTTDSDHAVGDAVDINQVNGEAIKGAGRGLGLELEAQALADPNTRYVEGPGGNWYRLESGEAWIRSKDLPTQDNHVHWSTFRH